MNLLIFLIIIGVSFLIVRIGAVAFELTGLDPSLARFQSLSCFSGTGFTTKESELITGNPQRRRIASVLIVLGHAGLVTMIATFANSLRAEMLINFRLPFLHSAIPSDILPLINLLVIIIAVYVIYKVFTHGHVVEKLTSMLKAHFIKRDIINPVSFEELLIATGGYGISQIEICKDSPILNQTLLESELRKHDITVLAVEREGETTPNPPASMKMQMGDILTCFGKLDHIRREMYSLSETEEISRPIDIKRGKRDRIKRKK